MMQKLASSVFCMSPYYIINY